ncbi:MAG: hypothetical protein ACKOK8_09625 [Planctomycetia bacterium]
MNTNPMFENCVLPRPWAKAFMSPSSVSILPANTETVSVSSCVSSTLVRYISSLPYNGRSAISVGEMKQPTLPTIVSP